MLDNFFESLYSKVLVNIVVKRASTTIYIETCSKSAVLNSAEESFDSILLNEAMISFVNSFTKETPFFYIAILDVSDEQGAAPTCSKNRLESYFDVHSSEYKCYDKKWTYHTSKTDLYAIEKAYKKIGVDYIFSPFSMLANFFKDKIETTMAMYILIQDSFISLSVFNEGSLVYGEHLDMQTAGESDDEMLSQDIEDELDIQSSINLEDIDVIDDMEALDDFGDIEDLDSLEEIDEFSENKDVEEEFYEAEEPVIESSDSSFNEDYQRYSLIHTALGHYYDDKKYESQFIESVYIADGVGVSTDLKRYLEEEMFLSVYVRQLNIPMEVAQLAKMELGL